MFTSFGKRVRPLAIVFKKGRQGIYLVCILSVLFSAALSQGKSRNINLIQIKDNTGKAVKQVELYKGSYALLIGASNYNHSWPSLESVPGELAKVEQLLMKKGFVVEKHLDPDHVEIEQVFENFIDRYGYNTQNRLLFYYSGHGYSRKNGRKGYLVPVDAPNPNHDEVGFVKKALGMNQILSWSRDIEAKHALFIFDSCFSGTIFKQKELVQPPKHITAYSTEPVRQFITAGKAGETVPANSTFTPTLIDGLKYGFADSNKDGYVTGTELGLYLQEKVPLHADQSPQFGKIRDYELSRGDFIFFSGGTIKESVVVKDSPSPSSYRSAPVTGSLKVTSKPNVAQIKLDGGSAGNTPRQLNGIPIGTTRVSVEKAGYLSEDHLVEIKEGLRAVIHFDLHQQSNTGWLTVHTSPANAHVRILNINTAYRPGINLKIGKYHLKVSSPGYESEERWVGLAAGIDMQVNVSLVKNREGAAAIRSTSLARNYIDQTTGMEFIYMSGNCFQMGSPATEEYRNKNEGPQHEVCVDNFLMGIYEVTVGQWRRFINESSYRTDAENDTSKKGCWSLKDRKWDNYDGHDWQHPGINQNDKLPVVCVSHNDAGAFISWLRRKSGRTYRLPTEAEWEYAARGGTATSRFWGNGENAACHYANVADISLHKKSSFSCDDGYRYLSPVGNYQPNPFGLYDILGNVWEWTGDWYGKDYYSKSPKENPKGTGSGSGRVIHGGGWGSSPASVRSANRGRTQPWERSSSLGFRLVLVP